MSEINNAALVEESELVNISDQSIQTLNESSEKIMISDSSHGDPQIEEEEEDYDEESMLLPLPTVSELKLKKFVAKKILAKAKSPMKKCGQQTYSVSSSSKRLQSVKAVANNEQLPHAAESNTPHSSNSQSSPVRKAIIYPDENKVREHQARANLNATEQISYSKVFAMSVEKKKPAVKAPDPQTTKAEEPQSTEEQTEPIKYKIPQNMLALAEDKVEDLSKIISSQQNGNHITLKSLTEKLYDEVMSRKRKHEDPSDDDSEQPASDNFQVPSRPELNSEMIDLLAEYRAISLYLLKKLDVDPINFNASDDYIKLYKLSRK